MVRLSVVLFVASLVYVSGSTIRNPVFRRNNPGDLRYEYFEDGQGRAHLVDQWQRLSDLKNAARFDPDASIEYHLFTRSNPTVSQPLVNGYLDILEQSYFDSSRRTVFLIHGWMGSVLAEFNLVLIPAYLVAEDVNVIAVDWHEGTLLLQQGVPPSGESMARFLSWLKEVADLRTEDIHVIGFSLGGHAAGIVGRNVVGGVEYISCLDPAGGGVNVADMFRPDDGVYTEAIYTNAGVVAFLRPLAQANFYPNGGVEMPGCGGNPSCNHDRCYYYMAESVISGGFTGTECESYQHALNRNCTLPGRLQMGGRLPTHGASGVYYMETNASPPFSMD